MKTFIDFPITLPPYSVGRWGAWEMRQPVVPYVKAGYWSDPHVQSNLFILKKDDVTWMSTTSMESESQQHFMDAAHGHTVIGGLGMGVLLWNVAKKPTVDHVTVVEKDDVIIAAFNQFANFGDWPSAMRSKIRIVNKDVLDFRPSRPVDVLIMDIWPDLGADEALADTRIVYSHTLPEAVGYWGQEFDFATWLLREIAPSSVVDHHWSQFRVDTCLPLVPAPGRFPGFAQLALTAVARQIMDRGIGLEGV